MSAFGQKQLYDAIQDGKSNMRFHQGNNYLKIPFGTKLIATLLMALSMQSAYAGEKDKNDDPYAKEVVDFINRLYSCPIHVAVGVAGGVIEKSQTSHLALENGALVIQEHIINADAVNVIGGRVINGTRIIDNTVRLNLLDLRRVLYVMRNDAVIECSQPACIRGNTSEGSQIKPIESNSWDMNFCNADKAQRAASAMKHLIEISK
jgi:hypothetical protein